MNEPTVAQAGYRPLQKFLTDRYADTVVLTFEEIESLLGFVLPEAARRQADWWATTNPPRTSSVQSQSWIAAGRAATPRLQAQTVTFERASGR